MPKEFTNDLEQQKKELEYRLKKLENNELEEISDYSDNDNGYNYDSEKNDDIEVKKNENVENDDDEEECMLILKDEIANLNNILENDDISSEEDNNLEDKVNNIIDKRKQLKEYTQDIDNLINEVETYIYKIMDKLDDKKTITKKDSDYLENEFKSIIGEFDIEYENIIGDMPKDLNLTKTYINKIDKRLTKLEYDVNKYI
jgi:predicted DNA-binding ArsR family transcriptional regulator